jgi:hypothetical protein
MSHDAPVTAVTAFADFAETMAEPRPYSAVEDTQ